jgi:hypothetical protein
MVLGGQAGARLAIEWGIKTGGDSLLRQLRRSARSLATPSPRVLGVDDWAWRKGRRQDAQAAASRCRRMRQKSRAKDAHGARGRHH